jgi:uncharacterized cupin superfamily protein
MSVSVERQVSEERKEQLGVEEWSPWSKEVSEFDWSYDDTETCYVIEGEVTVSLDGGESLTIRAGDLAQFEQGLSCTWNVTSDLRKVFTFGEVSLDPDESI